MSDKQWMRNLTAIVGTEHVSSAEADRVHHSRDQSSHHAHLPDVVVWPADTAQVSAVASFANSHAIPLVGWGAGTSIEGNPIPVRGGIVLDFNRMNNILTVHVEDFQVTVQPGLLYKDMNKELARYGLFFPPDPGANASIGGMVANNAAGIRTVKYGATRDNVLALEVVLASGEILRTGSRSVKQSSGYDLTRLFTGSEGTLGLITEATLKLAPIPEHVSAVTATFPTVEEAAEAVYGIIGSGLNPGALELLDTLTIAALNEESGFDLEAAPTLFIEFNGASWTAMSEELKLAEQICVEAGCNGFRSGMGRDAHRRLWHARHHAFETMVHRYPGKEWLVTDVAVPISRYPELVRFMMEQVAQHHIDGGLVGHAGDGNLHTLNFYDAADTDAARRIAHFNDALVAKALSLGGTSTGEHGVGMGKRKFMVQEHGEEAIGVMRALKQLLDPNNILNPDKVLA